MCGIAGFTHFNRSAHRSVAHRITETLYHRGPDQQGVFEGSIATLCAVRLKIIDLAGGNQPMLSDDGDTVIAFNGEIYNHLEIRAELEALGHRFRSRCDTETVLRAFLQWDTGCFARFRGMFAAAFWTESRQRLVLARDRMGIKPLYYYRDGDDVYFGSELKAIFEHPEVPRVLNLEALDAYLSVNYVPGPQTLIEGILKVRPGHFLDWRQGKVWLEPWTRSAPDTEPRPSGSGRPCGLEEAKRHLDHLLTASVREHLVSDVPLGVWASGGLDSSTVLHYAAAQTSGRLKTFSVSFAGRSFDESAYFREIARIYDTDHHEFDLNPDVDLHSAIEDFAYYSDEPSADAGALPVWFLSRMTRRHVTVALSGEGADELFGGYLTYQADRFARPFRLVPSPVRRALRTALDRYLPVSDEKISLEYKLKRWIDGSWLHPDEAHFFWNGTFSNQQRDQIRYGANGNGLRALVESLEIGRRGIVDRYLTVDQNYYLPDDILYKTDRMSMAHSVEVRPPFLDPRIVDFAAGLPQHLKIRGFKQKYVLKELMRGKLPESILNRKKTGFDIPTHDWFRGPLRGLLLDTLREDTVHATGIFDSRAIDSLIRDHMERRTNIGYHLWGLLMLFLWMKRWKVEAPPRAEMPARAAARVLAIS
jgi:asparagine synthase (glutamine-hydrolysing)